MSMEKQRTGRIVRSISGFYDVQTGDGVITCRARGILRKENCTPLTGDMVNITVERGKGMVEKVLPRRNCFVRPAVANIDALVVFAANVNPITEPFLIDRVVAIAEGNSCESVICINKCDLVSGEDLAAIYQKAGFPTVQVSALIHLRFTTRQTRQNTPIKTVVKKDTDSIFRNKIFIFPSLLLWLLLKFLHKPLQLSDILRAQPVFVIQAVHKFPHGASKKSAEQRFSLLLHVVLLFHKRPEHFIFSLLPKRQEPFFLKAVQIAVKRSHGDFLLFLQRFPYLIYAHLFPVFLPQNEHHFQFRFR